MPQSINASVNILNSEAWTTSFVEEVVSVVGIFRRSLERRFKDVLGRSIHTEIRRTRVAQIEKYLVESNLQITVIAFELDFPGVGYVACYFRAEKRNVAGCLQEALRADIGRLTPVWVLGVSETRRSWGGT